MSIRKFAIFVVRSFLKIFYKHKVYGIEHLPKGAGIIASNHVSFLDPPIIGVSCPLEIHILARDSLFKPPIFGWLIRKLNAHPVVRGKGNSAAFRKTCELIEKGYKVLIFPEGTRSKDGELQKGQLGLGMLVKRTGCVVIPAYIHGSYDVWSVHRSVPALRGQTACVFGTPLDFSFLLASEGDKKSVHQEMADRTMQAIEQLKQWYLRGAQGSPP